MPVPVPVGKVKQLELREVIEKTLLRFLDLYSFKLRSVLAELTLTLATSSKWLELREIVEKSHCAYSTCILSN